MVQSACAMLPVERIDAAFRGASKEHAQAVLVLTGPQLNSRRRQITDLAARTTSQRYMKEKNL